MKCALGRASDWMGKEKHIEINTLEELLDLLKKEGSLVLGEPFWPRSGIELDITIYDDYME